MSKAGFDWVVIEQQHGPVSQESLLPLLHALELGGTTPMVRVGEDDMIGIARALDLGARGILVPMVNAPEQARAVASATRFHPLGTRSYGGLRHHSSPGEANADIVVLVMVETDEGMANLDEIFAVPGIDGVLLGPADLAVSRGLDVTLGAVDSVTFEAMDKVVGAARRHGKHSGTLVASVADARRLLDAGADFVLTGNDMGYVTSGAASGRQIADSIRSDSALIERPDDRNINHIRHRWQQGEVAFGAFVVLPAVASALAISKAGFDWVVIEQQHGPVAQESLLPLLHALELGGTTALIRVGENDQIGIARALDLGARGIIVPMLGTVEQARQVASWTHFAPMGTRSYGGLRNHTSPRHANEDIVVFVMIETREGMANIEEILAVPGIDGVMLGPADLALNMGMDPNLAGAEPAVLEAFETMIAAARKLGKRAGAIVFNESDARDVISKGATLVALGADLSYVAAGAAVSRALGEEPRKGGGLYGN